MSEPQQKQRQPIPLLALIALVLALSGLSRFAQSRALELKGFEGWVTSDPDSLYHLRRVERALTEEGSLAVAGTDDFLNFPKGSAIPWPPYYTYLAAGVLAPFTPDEEDQRRVFLEQAVTTLPLIFGVLASLVACLAGYRLAGGTGAWVAGSYHALCHVSIAYSNLGNGDHHSFVSFLSGALLLLFTWALTGERLRRQASAVTLGAAAGLLTGLLLGSWVGGMMLVIQLELVLAWLIVRQGRVALAGLAPFGLAFHLAALLALLPAVLASPWTEIEPWMLVNLSWFHLAFLGLGALVFVPLFVLRESSAALKRYPWIVALTLGALGAVLLTTDFAVARAIREGFDWASKTNEFMAGIRESRSLFAADAEPGAFDTLGYALVLVPLAWIAMAWRCFRKAELALLPWVVSVPLVGLQSLQQARFAEALVLPMSVLLAWAAGQLLQRAGTDGVSRLAARVRALPSMALGLVALLLIGLNHASSTSSSLESLAGSPQSAIEKEGPVQVAVRRSLNWLRQHSRTPADYGVLATWGHGHAIEWVARRPSVATNFGSYVGPEGYRHPARFFMCEDPNEAKALLAERRIRYVLVTSQLPDHLNSMIEMAAPESRDRWVDSAAEGRVKRQWFETMGARLMFGGSVFMRDELPSLGFLRLVHVSNIADPSRPLRAPTDISPATWIWEHVEGAQVEAYGEPGTELQVLMRLNFPKAQKVFEWRASATADESGRASLRVPYSTQQFSEESRVLRSEWRFGSFNGTLKLSEPAVRDGARRLVHGNP